MVVHLQCKSITITKVNICEQAIVADVSNIYKPRAEQEFKTSRLRRLHSVQTCDASRIASLVYFVILPCNSSLWP